jgi:hypothetical protein
MEQRLEIDPMTGDLIVHRGEDVEPLLEANKALYTSGDGYSPSREWRRAASIPMALIEKWLNEMGLNVFNQDHLPKVLELLDSSEYLYLRTAPGRLSRKPRRFLQRVEPDPTRRLILP